MCAPPRGIYLLTHTKFNIPQADYGEKKSVVKLKKKLFDRSFSALGEISHICDTWSNIIFSTLAVIQGIITTLR